MTVHIPSWLLWCFGVPMGVLVFWGFFLAVCLLWAHLRRPR